MQRDEPETIIRERISVTRQKIVVAKSFALEYFGAENSRPAHTDNMVRNFLEHVQADALEPNARVVLQPSGEWLPSLERKADAISWKLAAFAAVLELIHSNALMDSGTQYTSYEPKVGYDATRVKADWSFRELQIPYPPDVLLPPSGFSDSDVLCNPDLFLNNLDVPNMPNTVKEPLQEAVSCFRHELYTASVVMLGKASEEAWIDVGVALYKALPEDQTKKIEALTDPNTSIYKGLRTVLKLYEHSELKQVRRESGVRNLNDALIWSDTVRDSRNVVHAGNSPSTPNTYEKVAAILLGAVPRMRELYRVLEAAQKHEAAASK